MSQTTQWIIATLLSGGLFVHALLVIRFNRDSVLPGARGAVSMGKLGVAVCSPALFVAAINLARLFL